MLGLYVHIPFCKSLCTYCDFPKRINTKNEIIEDYIYKLINDIDSAIKKYHFDTIYIGGGTPNYLSTSLLEKILSHINPLKADFIEFSIEINYELLTEEMVKLFNEYKINRISIGVQTFNSKIGKYLNRISNYEELKDKINLLNRYNITNINLDFMFGLPFQKIKDVKEDLRLIKTLNIKHISYYSLILEDKSVLAHQIENNLISLPNEDLVSSMYDLIINTLKDDGFHHYEISNFAHNGYESKHNMIYWNLDPYLGIGMSAASFINNLRITNSKIINNYLIDDGIIKEEISNNELKQEFLWLGLRMIDGVSIKKYNDKFNSSIFDDFDFKPLIDKGLIIIDNDFIKLTRFGLEHGNYVFSYFVS